LVTAFHAVQVAIDAPRPMPGIIQVARLAKGYLRPDPSHVAVEVVLENPTDRPLVVTDVTFRTAPARNGYLRQERSFQVMSIGYR